MFVFLGVEVFFIPSMSQMLSLGNHGCFFSEKQTLVKIWPSSHLNKKNTHTQKEALGWGLFARFVRFMWSDVGRSWRAAPIYFATWWCFFFRYSQCLRTPEALTWLAGKIAQILRGETSSKGLVLVCKAAVSPPGMQSWQMKAVKGRDSGANKMPYQPGGFPGILGGG